jgi:AmmeMemoRadiSam system protein B
MSNPAPQAPAFNPNAPHQQKPHVRPLRGFPLQARSPEGKEVPMLGLADARQVSDKLVATVPAAQAILPLLDGTRSIDEIVTQVGRGLTKGFLEQFVAQLDDAALLFGPTFDALREEMHRAFDSQPNLPPGSTAAFAEALAIKKGEPEPPEDKRYEVGSARIPEVFDLWIKDAMERLKREPFGAMPKAIVVPHLDYPRGWPNYATAWGSLPRGERPDRIVILGTNHFGEATGVCCCDKGFTSPLGTSEVDRALVEALKKALGAADAARAFAHRFDHEREHSIELQLPWIHHVFGLDGAGKGVPVFGALIHDPSVNSGESYDGQGLSLDAFLKAMETALASMPGRTLIVASADLSHAGPAFGDRETPAAETEASKAFRNKVVQHDQEMLQHVRDNRPDDLVTAMAWQQNPTRWCSVGNLVATLKLARPQSVEFINYAGAVDAQGQSMVTSVALAMT